MDKTNQPTIAGEYAHKIRYIGVRTTPEEKS
jgi:hypothetical protein